VTARLPLVLGPNGLPQQLQAGDTLPLATTGQFGVVKPDGTTVTASGGVLSAPGGGGSGGVGIPVFGSRADALPAVIPGTTDAIQLLGYSAPGDNGGGTYVQTATQTFDFLGAGAPVPNAPHLETGGYPLNVFSTTVYEIVQGTGLASSKTPIIAGCLTIAILWDTQLGAPNPPQPPYTAPTPSFTDSAGNTYLLVDNGVTKAFAFSPSTGTSGAYPFFRPVGIYYCANPVAAPAGVNFFNISSHANNGATQIDVFCFPGFTGAVVDAVATAANDTSTSSVSLASGTLTAAQELVIGICHLNQSPVFTAGLPTYTLPAGWTDLSPPKNGRNVIACAVSSSAAGLTFNPTFTSGTYPTTTIVATFKTYPLASIVPLFWSLSPTAPVHAAQYGILPQDFSSGIISGAATDYSTLYRQFTQWLATLASPSNPSWGGGFGSISDIVPSGTVTISIANPAVVTLTMPVGATPYLRNGSCVSFSTTGALPHNGGTPAIVAGKRYFVQYGTVTFVSAGTITFQISETSIFLDNLDGQKTSAKGTAISTAGCTQSGTHYITSFGDNWTVFVVDPGVYYAGINANMGAGAGLRKIKLLGDGSYTKTDVYYQGTYAYDPNANTAGTNVAYSAQFQTTNQGATGAQPNQITLNTPGQAVNFYVNSYVLLMALEMQSGKPSNWNMQYFEYQKVKSVNASTGVIIFHDYLKYNYRSTFPIQLPPPGNWSGAVTGPATIVQLSDIFDQQVEVHGQTFYAATETDFVGMLYIGFFDCDFYNTGFDSGPLFSTMIRAKYERCRFHYGTPQMDKMVDLLEIIECDYDEISYPFFQSASWNRVIIDKCQLRGGLAGTTKDMTIINTEIYGAMKIGAVFGVNERLTLINSNIPPVVCQFQQQETRPIDTDTTFSNGAIKILPNGKRGWFGQAAQNNGNPLVWAAPGAKVLVYMQATANGIGSAANVDTQETLGAAAAFACLDVCVDGSDNYSVDTDLPFLPSTTITFTGTVSNGSGGSGNVLDVTGSLSPSDACLMSGMVVSGTGLTPIFSFGGPTPGTGYVGGGYASVPLTGGSGSGATATISVDGGGHVYSVIPVNHGTGYAVGDVMSASAANLGGTGSGFSIVVAMVGAQIVTDIGVPSTHNSVSGQILTRGAITAGTLYTTGSYTNVPLTGGSGTGATANITVLGGGVTAVTIVNGGINYAIGDTMSAAAANIGGTGSGFSFPVATVSGYVLDTSASLSSRTFTAKVKLSILPHPAPRLTVINCTGSRFVADMAGAPAEIPAYSYCRRAFSGLSLAGTNFPQGKFPVMGNLKYWEIDVQKPYTGAQGTYTLTIYMFGFQFDGAGNYYPTVLVGQVVNLKTAGVRRITTTAVIGNVSGDTLAAVSPNLFLTGGHTCVFTAASGETLNQFPRVVMTAQCDQGIDYAGMSLSTTTSGIDQLADTIPQMAL
jgi:hypothetical protein